MTQMKDVDIGELIKAIVLCHAGHEGAAKFPYEILPYPHKVTLRVMEKLCDQGVLEYGVSLRTAWVEWPKLREKYPEVGNRWIVSCKDPRHRRAAMDDACFKDEHSDVSPNIYKNNKLVYVQDSEYRCDYCKKS